MVSQRRFLLVSGRSFGARCIPDKILGGAHQAGGRIMHPLSLELCVARAGLVVVASHGALYVVPRVLRRTHDTRRSQRDRSLRIHHPRKGRQRSPANDPWECPHSCLPDT